MSERPDPSNYDDYNNFVEDLISWRTEQTLSRVGEDSEERTFRGVSRALVDRDRARTPPPKFDWDFLSATGAPDPEDRRLGMERLATRKVIEHLRSKAESARRAGNVGKATELEGMASAQENIKASGGDRQYSFQKEHEAEIFKDASRRLSASEGKWMQVNAEQLSRVRSLVKSFNHESSEEFSYDIRTSEDGQRVMVTRLDHAGLQASEVSQSPSGEERLSSLMALQFPPGQEGSADEPGEAPEEKTVENDQGLFEEMRSGESAFTR